jgi:hypothetical protein
MSEKQKRYEKTDKGRAARKKWMKSEKGNAYRRRVAKTPGRKKTTRQAMWRHAGIDMDYPRYLTMVEECHNACPLCSPEQNDTRLATGKDLVVDHDHETNKVRGLLCNRHNLVLGHIDKIIDKIVQYLKRGH